MKKNNDRWKKFIAVSIVSALSAGLSYLMHFLSSLMRPDIIERKNLRSILDEIEKSNVDVHTLSNVLREPPKPLPFFIVLIIGTAVTVWAYQRILGLICKNQNKKK